MIFLRTSRVPWRRVEREARLRVEAERDVAQTEASNWQAKAAKAQAMFRHRGADCASRAAHREAETRTVRAALRAHGAAVEQLELQLEDLVTAASEDELAAAAAAAKTQSVRSFTRKRPVRKPWPENIERERVVIEPPTTCACCGGSRLSKLGEDVTDTLEEIPRRFKLIEAVREKFTCRFCEKISEPPAPFHVTSRGFIGPQLPATILFEVRHACSLNRQSARFKAEGIDLPVSTLADQVGHGTFAVMPLFHLTSRPSAFIGDDTTIRILAKSKCTTGRIWTYVRDDRPFSGHAPPAAVYYASSD